MPTEEPVTERIDVRLESRSYPVIIGAGHLERVGAYCSQQKLGAKALLITNERVGELYAGIVLKSLHKAGFTVHYATIPDGEEYKTVETATGLYDACVDAGLDRSSFVVALGGGVVGDVAGFVAATYMRGIDFVQVPTSLLAQVDASVGGKTAVNYARGKNLIGSFHQPRLVVIDVSILVSLDKREFVSGLAEVVKHGLIADRDLFTYCENEWFSLLRLNKEAVGHVVRRSVKIKANVVEADERESGLRAILNFGHTVGHGIEAATDYRYRHGEAVAIGMVVEGRLSVALGMLPAEDFRRVEALLEQLGLPTEAEGVEVYEVVQAMAKDKKVQDGKLRFALLDSLGQARVVADLPEEAVVEAYSRREPPAERISGG